MSYEYKTERANVFTEHGQEMFIAIRDQAKLLTKKSGAVTSGALLNTPRLVGSNWTMLACVDRLVELGELIEVPNPHSTAGQHRIFLPTLKMKNNE